MLDTNAALTRDAALIVSDLRAWYGDSQALFGVDIRVAENEVVALVGRNGAGKTTILRAIMGLLPRLSGQVIVHGRETAALRPSERARLGLGYCPEERAVFASLTVSENIALPPVLGSQAMTEEEIFGLFPKLGARRGHFGGQLSGGEQQMLAIGRILRTGAKILILDEPTEGLAPLVIRQIEDAITALKRRGYTILLVEQNLLFVHRVADRVVAIESGTVADQCQAGAFEDIEARLARYLAL